MNSSKFTSNTAIQYILLGTVHRSSFGHSTRKIQESDDIGPQQKNFEDRLRNFEGRNCRKVKDEDSKEDNIHFLGRPM